jgi:hypothetical protein
VVSVAALDWAHVSVDTTGDTYHFTLLTMDSNDESNIPVWNIDVSQQCGLGAQAEVLYPDVVCARAGSIFVSGLFVNPYFPVLNHHTYRLQLVFTQLF